MDPLLPSIFRKSVRLITPHIPIPIPIMYWGISVPDPSNIMHIIRILWSVSDKEVTLARWATTNCHWASVFGKWDLPFFSPFNHFSLFLSFPFSVLSGNLPCNCCSLHHRIAWLHSSHSYRLPVTEWGASPTGHKPPPWSPSPCIPCAISLYRSLPVFSVLISFWKFGGKLSPDTSLTLGYFYWRV